MAEPLTMEPDMVDTHHMRFVDGRCSCCPYGYHVDLDFLRFLNSEETNLSDLKKIHRDKRHLRKSLEIYLQQQQQQQQQVIGQGQMSCNVVGQGQLSRDGVDGGREGGRRVEIETSTVTKRTTEFSGGVNRTQQQQQQQQQHRSKKYRTEAEVMLSRPVVDYDSCSSVSALSSGPSSPRTGGQGYETVTWEIEQQRLLELERRQKQLQQLQDQLAQAGSYDAQQQVYLRQQEQLLRKVRESNVTDEEYTRYQQLQERHRKELEQQKQQLQQKTSQQRQQLFQQQPPQQQLAQKPQQQTWHPQSGQPSGEPWLQQEQVIRRPVEGLRDDLKGPGGSRPGGTRPGGSRPGGEGSESDIEVNVAVPTGVKGPRMTSEQLASEVDSLLPPQGEDDTLRISAATLQAIREQITASLQRMRELEEQNKAIPVLQVRVAVLKEEKKMLGLQLQAASSSSRHPQPGTFIPTGGSPQLDQPDGSTPGGLKRAPRTRSVGVGDSDIRVALVPATMSSLTSEQIERLSHIQDLSLAELGFSTGADGIPMRVHEKELSTEQNTEVREKEVRTVFIGGSGGRGPVDLLDGLTAAPTTKKPSPPIPPAPRVSTRSIGVGSGNVFDTTSSNMQVHEKEMRTVYIGGDERVERGKSTRNVGILCKVAMRDVGMVHFSDNEKPMTRNIAVGAGEMGVGEGAPMFYWGGDSVVEDGGGGEGGEEGGVLPPGSVHMMNTAINQINMAAFQTKHIHVKNDQIRSIIDEMLRRDIRSVETQCRFSTEEKSTDTDKLYDMVDVGVSDDVIGVDVVPKRVMKSVAIDHRPSLFHRAIGTDILYRVDMATNTSSQGLHSDRSTNTDKLILYPASTNTESPPRHTSSTTTDPAVFLALKATANTGTSVDQSVSTCGINTDITGEVDALNARPPRTDSSTHTGGLIGLFDRGISTEAVRTMERGLMTQKLPQSDKSVSTDKIRQSVAAVNTLPVKFLEAGGEGSALKSIMKTTSSTVETSRTSQRKGISFSDNITTRLSPVEGDSGSEGGSHCSLLEPSNLIDLSSSPSEQDQLMEQRVEHDQFLEQQEFMEQQELTESQGFTEQKDEEERGEELLKSCHTYSEWLQDSTRVSARDLNSSLSVIQREWFSASGQKGSSVEEVERVLSVVRNVSSHLIQPIINIVDSNGNMSLHYAVSNCNVDIVDMILDTGCCEVNKRNHSGYTAAMLATRAGLRTERELQVAKRLLEAGDVNMKSIKGGETALMLAARHGQVEMVQLLLDTGASVNLQDDDGSTALMGACENGYTDIVRTLLQHPDIDISLTDNDGSSAMSIAMEAKHRDVGVLLYAHENFRSESPQTSASSSRSVRRRTYTRVTTSGSGPSTSTSRVTHYSSRY